MESQSRHTPSCGDGPLVLHQAVINCYKERIHGFSVVGLLLFLGSEAVSVNGILVSEHTRNQRLALVRFCGIYFGQDNPSADNLAWEGFRTSVLGFYVTVVKTSRRLSTLDE